MTDHHNTDPAPSDGDLPTRLGFHAMPDIRPTTSSHDNLLARLAHETLHGVRPAVTDLSKTRIVPGSSHWAPAMRPHRDGPHDTADSQDYTSCATPAAARTQLPPADDAKLLRERIRDAVVSLENIHDRLIFDNPDAAEAIAAVTFRLMPSAEEDLEHPKQGEAPGDPATPPSRPLSGHNEHRGGAS
ncbi:hypothetical protein [Kitasatospora sp. NPDC015120]|uniref:hypothetical protein n=1 Tax=Kitasatospora sp. NPDC015120 TaxID=3364023 RepID=UPI0036F46C45